MWGEDEIANAMMPDENTISGTHIALAAASHMLFYSRNVGTQAHIYLVKSGCTSLQPTDGILAPDEIST